MRRSHFAQQTLWSRYQLLLAAAATHLGEDLRVGLQRPRSSLSLSLGDWIGVHGSPKRGSLERAKAELQVNRIEPPQHVIFYPMQMREIEQVELRLHHQAIEGLEIAHVGFADHHVGVLQHASGTAQNLFLGALNIELE